MKNKIVIFSILVIVLGLGAYLLSQKSSQIPMVETSMQPTAAMMKLDQNVMESDKMTTDLRYVKYNQTDFESASNGRRVLFFYASWCPTCIPADASFSQNTSKIPNDVTLIRVNYNDPETDQEEKDLAKKYGITYQHTFVQIDATGKEVVKWNGGKIEELLSNLK